MLVTGTAAPPPVLTTHTRSLARGALGPQRLVNLCVSHIFSSIRTRHTVHTALALSAGQQVHGRTWHMHAGGLARSRSDQPFHIDASPNRMVGLSSRLSTRSCAVMREDRRGEESSVGES